jgi:hypothetical protein
MTQIVPPLHSGTLGAQVWRFADVVIVRTNRVNLDFPSQTCRLNLGAKHRFRRGRPANIAHANKKYFDHFLRLDIRTPVILSIQV